jgi:hypothetical protein
MDSEMALLTAGARTQCVKDGIGLDSRLKGRVGEELNHAASCVEIHQVLPQGSFTPPRRSGSPGL